MWAAGGFIETHPGRTIDFDIIEDWIFDFIQQNRMVKEFALDMGFSAWPLMSSLQKRLERSRGKKATDDLLVEYGKTVKNFPEPMKQPKRHLLTGISFTMGTWNSIMVHG